MADHISYKLIHGGKEHGATIEPDSPQTIENIRNAIATTAGNDASRGLYLLLKDGEDNSTIGDKITEKDRLLFAAQPVRQPKPDPTTQTGSAGQTQGPTINNHGDVSGLITGQNFGTIHSTVIQFISALMEGKSEEATEIGAKIGLKMDPEVVKRFVAGTSNEEDLRNIVDPNSQLGVMIISTWREAEEKRKLNRKLERFERNQKKIMAALHVPESSDSESSTH